MEMAKVLLFSKDDLWNNLFYGSKILFLFVFTCILYIYVCWYAHMCASVWRGQKRAADTLELEFHMVVSCLSAATGNWIQVWAVPWAFNLPSLQPHQWILEPVSFIGKLKVESACDEMVPHEVWLSPSGTWGPHRCNWQWLRTSSWWCWSWNICKVYLLRVISPTSLKVCFMLVFCLLFFWSQDYWCIIFMQFSLSLHSHLTTTTQLRQPCKLFHPPQKACHGQWNGSVHSTMKA